MLKLTSFNHFEDRATKQIRELFGNITITYVDPPPALDHRDSPRIYNLLLHKQNYKGIYFGWFEKRSESNSDYDGHYYNVSGTLMLSGLGIVKKHYLPYKINVKGFRYTSEEGLYHKENIKMFTSEQINELFSPFFEKWKQPQLF